MIFQVPGQMMQKASRDIPRIGTKNSKSRLVMCLETLVEVSDLTDGAIRQIDMEEGVFGFSHSKIIAKEDMDQLFQQLELGIGVMHAYIWYSDQSII